MSPLVIGMIIGPMLFGNVSVLDLQTAQTALLIDLALLLIAFAAVYYLISTTPPSDTMSVSPMRPFAPTNAMEPSAHDILTVPEAAAYLRVTEDEVMRLIDEGKLPAARMGDSFHIARIAIDDYLKEAKSG
jgi:excisionase family DNA binding protein